MKKLLILLAIWPVWLFSQTDQSVDELPAKTALTGAATEYLYLLDNITDKHFTGAALVTLIGDSAGAVRGALIDTALAIRTDVEAMSGGEGYWKFKMGFSFGDGFSRTIYPMKSFYYTAVTIGEEPPSSHNSYKLTVNGESKFKDLVTFNDDLKLGISTYIKDSLSDIWFESSAAGKLSLLDLTELPTSLIADWTLNKGVHDIVITDGSGNGFSWIESTNILALTTDAYIDLNAPTTRADSLSADEIGAGQIWADTTCLNGDCITDWVEIGGGGIGGTYIPGSSNDLDTAWAYIISSNVPQYNSNDTLDAIPIIQHAHPLIAIYDTSITVTATQINNGDVITILPVPGSGKYINIHTATYHRIGGTAYGDYDSYLYFGSDAVALVYGEIMNATADKIQFLVPYNNGIFGLNTALTLDFNDSLSGGTGGGIIRVTYEIVTE